MSIIAFLGLSNESSDVRVVLWTPCTCVCAESLQWCPALCDPMDCSPPGSSVRGILQSGILEWVAMPSSGEEFPDSGIKPVSFLSSALACLLNHSSHVRLFVTP